jgi:hypothetical protein
MKTVETHLERVEHGSESFSNLTLFPTGKGHNPLAALPAQVHRVYSQPIDPDMCEIN